MSFLSDLRVKDLPKPVRRWLEKVEGKKLPDSHKVWVSAFSTRGPNKWGQEWKQHGKRRERRLKRVAGKMRKAKMDERDVRIVIRGGWDE